MNYKGRHIENNSFLLLISRPYPKGSTLKSETVGEELYVLKNHDHPWLRRVLSLPPVIGPEYLLEVVAYTEELKEELFRARESSKLIKKMIVYLVITLALVAAFYDLLGGISILNGAVTYTTLLAISIFKYFKRTKKGLT